MLAKSPSSSARSRLHLPVSPERQFTPAPSMMSPGVHRGRTASAQDLGQMSCNWKEGRGGLSWRPGSAAGQWCELPAPSLSIHHAVRSEKGMPCLGMLSTQWPSWCVRGALNTHPLLTESGCDPCRGHNLLKGPQLNSRNTSLQMPGKQEGRQPNWLAF